MKVLEVTGPARAEYTEKYPRPICGPDDIVIRVHRNGICATDMAIYSGEASFLHDGSTDYPVRFGHEFAGDIVEKGENVTEYEIGDRAISWGYVPCGHCPACLKGDYDNCENNRCTGTINTWPGSYAEYVSFPSKYTIRIPPEFSYDQITLVEPGAIAMEGVRKSHIRSGESVVLVIGVGPIGIAAAALAKYAGARQVIISGRTPWKLKIAAGLGAGFCHNPGEEGLTDYIRRVTNGHGADAIIECSGNLTVIDDCLHCLAPSGTLVTVAFYDRPCTHFDLDELTLKNARIESVKWHDFDGVIQAMQDGVDLTPLITRHIPFEEAADYFEKNRMAQKKEDIKVVVDIQ